MASDPSMPADANASPALRTELLINGSNHSPVDATAHNDETSTDNPSLHSGIIALRETTSSVPTKPTEHVNGIQPVSDYPPKVAPVHSHPTPPPDQPLEPPAESMDVEMSSDDTLKRPLDHEATPPPPPHDAGLVRPREDDEDEERLVKRSKVESDGDADVQPDEDVMRTVDDTNAVASVDESVLEAEPMLPSSGSEAAGEASTPPTNNAVDPAGQSNTDDTSLAQSIHTPAQELQAPQETQEPQEPPKSQEPQATTQEATIPTPSAADASPLKAQPVTTSVETAPPPKSTLPAPAQPAVKYSTTAMTPMQRAFIADKMKNLKKTKHSIAFLRPVDYVALNIPAYPEIIKTPMDLGTMETKLKADQYNSVQDFVDDFDLIINNCRRFNGDAHPVTQAGLSMEAYFKKMMEAVPSPDQAVPAKPAKKRSPSIGNKPVPRREPRAAAAAAAATAAPVKAETFALQPDGTPQIRRDSTGRPARAIKPPQSRDLTYAKPKRKEALLELKFCEFVLDELRSTKYDKVNSVFLYPVDPVALNIPHYRQVIKTPMDLSTMGQKLRHGQYAKASEFKKDFELMISNCLLFNPHGNPVRDMGVQFQRDFAALWAQKDRWEKANKPEPRATSVSADEDSADEDDDDEAPDDDKEATIQALQKQLLDMQNTILSMAGGKAAKPKKNKQKTKKSGSMSAVTKTSKASASKVKPKKPKQVTYEEKQEISEAVGRMNDAQVTKLTQIITENCAKYRDMDEMELEIDDLPNDVQAMLLKYVRSLFGNPNKGRAISPDDVAAVDDDDFEPSARGGTGGKRKKHKPMGKREQGEAIKNLQSKLAQFNNGAPGSSSESATHANPQADSSSDEESEESEEE